MYNIRQRAQPSQEFTQFIQGDCLGNLGIVGSGFERTMSLIIEENRKCPHCNKLRGRKDTKQLVMHTLFGELTLPSPRFYTCSCQSQSTKSITPLAHHFPERTTPELRYLQSKWASLASYGITVNLLEEVLPLKANTTTIRRQVQKTAGCLERDMPDD